MEAEQLNRVGDSGLDSNLARSQSNWFLITYTIAVFLFPFTSYVSEFVGIQSNFLSIMARAIIVLAILLYGGFLIINGIFRPVPLFYLFLVFWILYSIRILHDTFLFSWQLGRKPSEYFLFAFVLSFFCSIPFFVPVKFDFKKADRLIFIALIVLNLLGVYNNLNAENLFAERLGGNERLNPIVFGMLGGLLMVASFIQLLSVRANWVKFIIAAATLFLGLANLLIAASKSPIIFTLLSLFIITWHSLKKGKYRAAGMLFFMVCISVFSIFYFGLQEVFLLAVTRFTEISSDASSYERLDMLLGGLRQFLEDPLLGSFLEEKINKEYPHNLILESFMATGIVGGVIFSIFYLSVFWATIKNITRSQFTMPGFIALSSLIFSLFSGGLSFYVDFWLNSAIMLAMYYWVKLPGQAS
jgi:O-antigen ligase